VAPPTDPSVIHVDRYLAHPPSLVWQPLVDPEQLTAWFMANDFVPVVGHRFTFRTEPIPETTFSRVIACEVLGLREAELLSYSWVDAGREGGLDSVVTWTLRPEGHGTRLFLEHRGFRSRRPDPGPRPPDQERWPAQPRGPAVGEAPGRLTI